jgi:hypothetical protein
MIEKHYGHLVQDTAGVAQNESYDLNQHLRCFARVLQQTSLWQHLSVSLRRLTDRHRPYRCANFHLVMAFNPARTFCAAALLDTASRFLGLIYIGSPSI